jgi:iron complex transport system ATP-binding protein
MKIQINNLTVGYANKPVLSAMNMHLTGGDMIMLIGKNGSGKSTLLKSLAGIIPFLSGEIIIDGLSLNRLSPAERSRLIAIVLTQRVAGNLNVFEFIRMGRYAYTNRFDILSREDKKIIDKYIERLKLNNLIQRNLTELSDGERQKVMLARALVQETPVLLLDEPATHLDLENKAELIQLLFHIKEKENKIILFSSHDLNLFMGKIKNIWMTINGNLKTFDYSNFSSIQDMFQNDFLYYDEACRQFRIH